MPFKIIVYSLLFISIIGCNKPNPVDSTLPSDFIYNRINCEARVYYRNDSVMATQIYYGLNGYFSHSYGRVTSQIISINKQFDTTVYLGISENPNPINPPVGSINFKIPNILENIDSVKVYAKIFGVYFTDSTKQIIKGEFYHYDSVTVKIQRFYFVLPANQSLKLTW